MPSQEQSASRKAASGLACTWSVVGDSLVGPWDIPRARPFTAAPFLFAAPLVRQRNGSWAFVGFENREPEGFFDFAIIDPIPVRLTVDQFAIA